MQFDLALSVNNCAVKFGCDFSLTINGPQTASVSLSFSLDTLFRGSCNYGYATLPPVLSIGGVIPPGYGVSTEILSRLVSTGEGGFYIPSALEYGFAFLPTIISFGLVKTSATGTGSSTLPSVKAKGGTGHYGEGEGTLLGLKSFGYEGPPQNIAGVFAPIQLYDGIIYGRDQIVFVNSYGYIIDTITGTKEYIASILAILAATGTVSILGSFIVSVLAEGALRTSMQGFAVSAGKVKPGVDSESRVWVVNIDTGATSQYDNYGFNSFIERDGEYFGLAEDGIYKLEGSTDAGFVIPWQVDFGTSDCGVKGRKKVMNVHIDTTNGTPMYLKIETELNIQTYKIEECLRGSTGWRAKVYEDMYGTAWNFTLISEGAAELTGIEFAPIKLSRRL